MAMRLEKTPKKDDLWFDGPPPHCMNPPPWPPLQKISAPDDVEASLYNKMLYQGTKKKRKYGFITHSIK